MVTAAPPTSSPATEPTGPDDVMTRFEDEVARVAGIRNAADAQLMDLVAQALRDGLWQGWRIHTPVQWLMWRAGLERSTAQRMVALARRAVELPVTMASFSEGRLSLDQAAKVARHTPAAYDASVCELAENATVAQIARATRQYGFDTAVTPPAPTEHEPEPEPPDPAAAVEEERSVTFGTDDGGWWARVRLPVDEGTTVEAALQAVREQLRRDDPDGRLSWADALVGMAHSALAHDAVGAERRARPRIVVHLETGRSPVDLGPGAAGSGQGSAPPPHWVASLTHGPPLPSGVRRHLTCDADFQVLRLRDGRPIEAGRARRDPPEALRRFVQHRDQGCRVHGCDTRLWLHLHHIEHWEDGGETTSANLCSLCPAHHRLHHQGLLGIRGDADGELTFTDHTGRPMGPAGRPRPPGPGQAPPAEPYAGPTGERLDITAVHFTPAAPEPSGQGAAAGREVQLHRGTGRGQGEGPVQVLDRTPR